MKIYSVGDIDIFVCVCAISLPPAKLPFDGGGGGGGVLEFRTWGELSGIECECGVFIDSHDFYIADHNISMVLRAGLY